MTFKEYILNEILVQDDKIKKIIFTKKGNAKYIGTEISDEYSYDYNIRDGYYVIHDDNKHHVYELSRR